VEVARCAPRAGRLEDPKDHDGRLAVAEPPEMMEALGLHVHLIEVALASHDEHVRFVNGVKKNW